MLAMHAADWVLQWISSTDLTSALDYQIFTDDQCVEARKLETSNRILLNVMQ